MTQSSDKINSKIGPQNEEVSETQDTPSTLTQNTKQTLSHVAEQTSGESEIIGNIKKDKFYEKLLKDEYLPGVIFFPFLGVALLSSMVIYSSAHGINYFALWKNPLKFSVDFVGGERNAYSIGIEASTWAFWGATCRIAYVALRAILEGKFRFFKYMAIWFGTVGFAWGVSVALIFSLSVISFNIGTTKITLADASIETIIAIAFIIGFYNEQALTLLEHVRDRLTGGMKGEISKKE